MKEKNEEKKRRKRATRKTSAPPKKKEKRKMRIIILLMCAIEPIVGFSEVERAAAIEHFALSMPLFFGGIVPTKTPNAPNLAWLCPLCTCTWNETASCRGINARASKIIANFRSACSLCTSDSETAETVLESTKADMFVFDVGSPTDSTDSRSSEVCVVEYNAKKTTTTRNTSWAECASRKRVIYRGYCEGDDVPLRLCKAGNETAQIKSALEGLGNVSVAAALRGPLSTYTEEEAGHVAIQAVCRARGSGTTCGGLVSPSLKIQKDARIVPFQPISDTTGMWIPPVILFSV